MKGSDMSKRKPLAKMTRDERIAEFWELTQKAEELQTACADIDREVSQLRAGNPWESIKSEASQLAWKLVAKSDELSAVMRRMKAHVKYMPFGPPATVIQFPTVPQQ